MNIDTDITTNQKVSKQIYETTIIESPCSKYIHKHIPKHEEHTEIDKSFSEMKKHAWKNWNMS